MKQKWRDLGPARKVAGKKSELEAARQKVLAEQIGKSQLRVNFAALNPDYPSPDTTHVFFLRSGWYRDEPFHCEGCGKLEIWRAAQQKWWYEIAKGSGYTVASRRRSCRKVHRSKQEIQAEKTQAGYERRKAPNQSSQPTLAGRQSG